MKYKISLLEHFQKLPNLDSICNFILSNNNIQNYNYSKIFALILLEKYLQNKWHIYKKNEKINFLNFLTNLLIDNITSDKRLGNVPLTYIEKMCEEVGVLEDILSFDGGFNAVMTDSRDVSYGQKKKILLARAFLRKAQIYMFDEPTEGIDEASKGKIVELINNLARNSIVIVSTHEHLDYLNVASTFTLL